MRAGLLATVLLGGCATSQVFVPPEQASALQRTYAGDERFLKLSFHATPFFGDATKKLLSPISPDQLRLLTNPDGSPVNPGPSERIFPPGTPVRILKLEFPTSWAMSERVLYTPRSLAWVYLDVANTPKQSPPSILVLRPGLKDENEVRSEIDRYLSKENPKAVLDGFSEAVRAAVLEKKAVPDMSAEALEMAWGYPERKKYELEGSAKKETWFYADGRKQVVLLDGKVTELR
ncbi:MAG: hypothetical protein JNJ54_06540 [Myxococcaceae bacterium]|nr:hypothetical protein [Myxococcaceae bacterium]